VKRPYSMPGCPVGPFTCYRFQVQAVVKRPYRGESSGVAAASTKFQVQAVSQRPYSECDEPVQGIGVSVSSPGRFTTALQVVWVVCDATIEGDVSSPGRFTTALQLMSAWSDPEHPLSFQVLAVSQRPYRTCPW